MNERDGQSRVALITAGAGGIGFATAQHLLAEGYRIGICSRSQARLERAVADLDAGDSVLGVIADLAKPSDATSLVDQTVARFGGLDLVVNVHGIQGAVKPIELMTPGEWEEVLAVNLMGAIYTTTAAIPHLRARGGGAVVNVSSIEASHAEPLVSAYGVSKAALSGFTRYAAAELAKDDIRVNTVAPGWVRTSMTEPFLVEAQVTEGVWTTNMVGRPGKPSEIATTISFLANSGAGYITGQTIVADGGHTVLLRELGIHESDS